MLHGLLNDGHNGTLSSKRVITLLSFLLCAWGFVADTMGHKVNPELFNSLMYIVIAGLGFTASEKFTTINKESKSKGLL
jgi:hypothetical protein